MYVYRLYSYNKNNNAATRIREEEEEEEEKLALLFTNIILVYGLLVYKRVRTRRERFPPVTFVYFLLKFEWNNKQRRAY